MVPVTIRPPHPQNLQTTLPTVRMIVDVSKSAVVLSSQQVIKLLKSKEASNVVDIKVRLRFSAIWRETIAIFSIFCSYYPRFVEEV